MTYLTEKERYTQLHTWNDTEKPYPQEKCIHRVFEEQAARYPGAECIIFKGRRFTYREVDEQANKLAWFLQKKGAGKNTFAAVSMEKSPEMIISILGILKAGAAYVPIDPAYPEKRINYILDNAGISLIVDADFLSDHGEEIDRQSSRAPGGHEESSSAAYIIYTSGSTGKPKGVIVSHRNVMNLISWHNRVYGVNRDDRATQVANVSFDASVWEIWPYFAAGAALYPVPVETVLSPPDLQDFFITNRISMAFLPTPIAEKIIDLQWPECSLRYLLTGGDTLHSYPPKGLPFRLVNNYGPTENTVVTTFFTIETPLGSSPDGLPPIGRPIDNTRVYILDDNMELLPTGSVGELYIAGHGIAGGYINNPALTKKRFVPNPFDDDPGYAVLYKTGDLAAWRDDGTIDFRGRSDFQVKIRGYRIELGEIESAAIEYPGIEKIVVTAFGEKGGSRKLAAYVLEDKKKRKTRLIKELFRRFLLQKLPEYMVPDYIIVLDEFPLTLHGKIDRSRFPEPKEAISDSTGHIIHPRNDIEENIARIWGDVLEIDYEDIDIHVKFPELGGDSISMMSVISRLNRIGFHTGSFGDLHKKSIAQLAAESPDGRPVIVDQSSVSGKAPLSAVEKWFFQQNLANPHLYTMSFLFELPPDERDFDAGLFQMALDYVIVHHDNLRARFVKGIGGWEKYISLPGENREYIFETHREFLPEKMDRVQKALNIQTGPLLGGVLFHPHRERVRLFITIHHLLVDGVSWRVLVEDLFNVYHQLSEGYEPSLPEKSTSFISWVEKLRGYIQRDEGKKELSYWMDLKNKKNNPMKTDFPCSSEERTVENNEKIRVSLSLEESEVLTGRVPGYFYAGINDILLFSVLQACDEDSLFLNLEGHGREYIVQDVDLTRTVGWFTTIFPLFLQKKGDTQAARIGAVREALERMPHKGIGFGLLEYLCDESDVKMSIARLPRPEVCFNYLGKFNFSVPGEFAFTRDGRNGEPYLVDILGMYTGDGITFDFTYCGKAFERGRMEKWAGKFIETVKMLIRESDTERDIIIL